MTSITEVKPVEEIKAPLQVMGFIVDKIKRNVPRKWTFIPKADITVQELCILLPFLFTSGKPGIFSSDFEYLEKHNVLRHLIIEDALEILNPKFKKL